MRERDEEKEKERMVERERKRERERMVDRDRVQFLQQHGVIDRWLSSPVAISQ